MGLGNGRANREIYKGILVRDEFIDGKALTDSYSVTSVTSCCRRALTGKVPGRKSRWMRRVNSSEWYVVLASRLELVLIIRRHRHVSDTRSSSNTRTTGRPKRLRSNTSKTSAVTPTSMDGLNSQLSTHTSKTIRPSATSPDRVRGVLPPPHRRKPRPPPRKLPLPPRKPP